MASPWSASWPCQPCRPRRPEFCTVGIICVSLMRTDRTLGVGVQDDVIQESRTAMSFWGGSHVQGPRFRDRKQTRTRT
eukprot:13854237-Heterocapsa_arctica.AAC.1